MNTISKSDALRHALSNKAYQRRNWMVNAFAVTRETEGNWKRDPFEGRLVQQPWGYDMVVDGELKKVTDSKPNIPLFTMQESITVDETWAPNAKETMESNVGALISNYILLVDNFGSKIPYRPYKIDIVKDIEAFVIENRGIDIPGKPRDPTKIYLDEYLKMGQGVEFIRSITTLSTASLTTKNMTRPPGIGAKKKQLLKEKYPQGLDDPVDLANFEKEMGDFAAEYRKGDPSEGKLVSGKIKNNSIRKMFISSGAEGGMGTPMVPIVESLADGLTYSPKQLQALINGARAGSYFRGLDTVKGGVSFKLSVRVLASFFIGEDDCGSNLGLTVAYNKENIKQLVSRRIVGKESTPIQNLEEASNYLGKTLFLRTPGWCRSKSSVICKMCAGERLAKFPEGLAIPASSVTGRILAASMAAMHKNTTEVAILDLSKVAS